MVQRLARLALVLALLGPAGAVAAEADRVTVKAEGLKPSGCSSPQAVEGTLAMIPGVRRAEVSREKGEALIEFEPGKVDWDALVATVERACQVKLIRPAAR